MTSLADAINAKKSYGACRKNYQSVMLTVIHSKSISHKLTPSDTLQGLAIKYGVSVELLKRVNKLWFNESIHMKETLIIPYENNHRDDFEGDDDSSSNTTTNNSTKTNDNQVSEVDDNRLLAETFNSSGKENEEQLANQPIVDNSTRNSDALKSFNEMINKIDSQIKTQKAKNGGNSSRVPSIPVVSYDDSSYQNCAALLSPTRQHPFLEYNL